ncbi:MAG: hypothetical protein ACRD0C_00705 [Acidimicrobiia bacterium]
MAEAAPGDQRDAPWANLLAPDALDDPYGFLAALREEHGPVFWSGRHRAWLLTSFAQVVGGYRDDRLSSDRVGAIARHLDPAGRTAMAPTLELLRGWMVFRDEPDHTRLRDPVRWAFTPKAMEGLRAQVQSLVDELVERVVEAGTCDLVAAFAFPLPAMVIAHLLGVPAADRDKFGTWSRKLAAVVFGAGDDPARRTLATEGSTEFTEYFRWLVAQREAEPGDDLVSALVAAQGEEGLSADEPGRGLHAPPLRRPRDDRRPPGQRHRGPRPPPRRARPAAAGPGDVAHGGGGDPALRRPHQGPGAGGDGGPRPLRPPPGGRRHALPVPGRRQP